MRTPPQPRDAHKAHDGRSQQRNCRRKRHDADVECADVEPSQPQAFAKNAERVVSGLKIRKIEKQRIVLGRADAGYEIFDGSCELARVECTKIQSSKICTWLGILYNSEREIGNADFNAWNVDKIEIQDGGGARGLQAIVDREGMVYRENPRRDSCRGESDDAGRQSSDICARFDHHRACVGW